MASWTKCGENLVRYQGGTIYLRAKVEGKPVRVSLQTDDLRIAKIKRDAKLETIRTAAKSPARSKISTVGDAIDVVETELANQPHLKASTQKYYREMAKILRDTLPTKRRASEWTAAQASDWWRKIASSYAGQRANNVLAASKLVGKAMAKAGLRDANPFEALKRVKVTAHTPEIPPRETMEKIIASIRDQGKANSKAVALYVAFLAYSGCRVGEAAEVTWEDIGPDWLKITGGEIGTKNREVRRVPICPPLREVIEAMRYEKAAGPIFLIKRPRAALDSACKRLKLPHLRIHDLRHFFASWAIESGVEITTVAKWLGHKDGGTLLMRTYSHVRDQHSLDRARALGAPAAPVAPPQAGT
jgi:integrase